MPRRVAVTGAAGLIGRAVVRALARDARVDEVVAIDVRPPEGAPAAGVRAVRRDIRDPGLGADLAGADALVHLAFVELGRRAAGEGNLAGARNVFEAALAAGVEAVVHASSASIYAGADFEYPRVKLAIEELLRELAAGRPGTRFTCLRPTTVLGPGAPLLLARRAYVSLSDYDPPMQFTWVDDAAAAFVAALHADAATGPIDVGAPGTVPASEVAGLLGVRSLRLPYRARRAAAVAMTRLRVPGALHPGYVDMHRYPLVVSAERAERLLGWRARHDTAGALRRFAATLH